jgi:hypothetical protein
MRAAQRLEPEIMAHPDIVDDPAAIAEALDIAQQARGRLVEAVIIGGGDLLAMRRDQDVADFERGMLSFTGKRGQFRPAIDRCGQHRLAALDIALRDKADEHAVDIGGMNRLAGQAIARLQRRKGQFDLRVARCATGVVPQADIPGTRLACGIAALDRQRRPMRHIERQHPAAAPAKAQHAMGVVALRFIGEQRMVEPVFALPDQSRQFALVEECAIHAQRIGCGGDHAGHHRAREIDRPEARVEALDMIGMLPLAVAGKPE